MQTAKRSIAGQGRARFGSANGLDLAVKSAYSRNLAPVPDEERDTQNCLGYAPRMAELIEHIDGIDTVALQTSCPELFDVTAKQDGMTRWRLRPEVRAVLRRLHRTIQ